MADRYFNGGAATQTQVDTLTVGGTFTSGHVFQVKLIAEDESSQTEQYTATSASTSTVTVGFASQLNASSNSLFQKVTWTNTSTTVVGTADVAGVPFYTSASVSTTGSSGTFSLANTTPNRGPMDWFTSGNWTGSNRATSADVVRVVPNTKNGKSYQVKYGLWKLKDASFKKFYISDAYDASVGDPKNGYYLKVKVANTSGSNTPKAVLNGRGRQQLINFVDCNACYINRAARDDNSIKLDGSIDSVFINGPDVRGKIRFADSMTLDDLYVVEAPNAQVEIGESISSFDSLEMNSGEVTLESGITGSSNNGRVRVGGGKLIIKTHSSNISQIRQHAGHIEFAAGGETSTVYQNGGRFVVSGREENSLTFVNVRQRGGTFDALDAIGDVSYTNFYPDGGTANVDQQTVTNWQES
jgi:hypothetical protein